MNYEITLLLFNIALLANFPLIVYYFIKFTKYMFYVKDIRYNKRTERARLYFHIISLPLFFIPAIVFQPINTLGVNSTLALYLSLIPTFVGIVIIGTSWLKILEAKVIKLIEGKLQPVKELKLKEHLYTNDKKKNLVNKWIDEKIIDKSSEEDCLNFLNQSQTTSKIKITSIYNKKPTYIPLLNELDKIYEDGIYSIPKNDKTEKELYKIIISNFTLNGEEIKYDNIRVAFREKAKRYETEQNKKEEC